MLEGHPLLSEGDGPYAGWLVFEGVSSSSRTVTEYIGGPKAPGGYLEPYFQEDGPYPAQSGDQNVYTFEGLQIDPLAWIDNWIVRAASFQFLRTEG